MNYITIIWRLQTPVSTRILRLAKKWWKYFKNILSETDLVPLQHLRWSYLWQLTTLVNGNWNHCLAIVRKSPILDNAWILDLRLRIKKSIFDKIRIRGSHLDLQKHPLMVASWKFIHKEFISKQPLNSVSKTREKSSTNISERTYFLTHVFDFIRIRGSHQDFAEHLSIVPENAIFHNEKQPLKRILKTLFLKTTPVNYRNRRMINNRSIKHCVSRKILEKYMYRGSYFSKLGF